MTLAPDFPVSQELELFRSSVENEEPSKADKGKTMSRLRKLSSSGLSDGGDCGSPPRSISAPPDAAM